MNIQEHLCLIVFALQLKQTWTWHQWLLRGLDPGRELLRRHILPFDIRQDQHKENPKKVCIWIVRILTTSLKYISLAEE